MGSVWILGIIQGFTEFLPVSSSGHLILAKEWLGLQSPGAALEVALHLGTLAAILWAYRAWLHVWVRQLWRGDGQAWATLWRLAVASVPAALAGVFVGHLIEKDFSLESAALGWLCTTLILLITPRPMTSETPLRRLSLWQAIAIGCAQALALWPGLSRSGTTITMARVCGIEAQDAAQFSFLMAIPVTLGASIFEVPQLLSSHISIGIMASGCLVAAITGLIAIKWVKGIVSRPRWWKACAIYTAAIAILGFVIGG